uniref:Uncharacterized protein n=1 Tax=Trichogramma kaykai TaxID=54128 RepID=A0ABD2VX20_9HYME
MRGHTLLASPPELDFFFRTRCLVPSCECGSRSRRHHACWRGLGPRIRRPLVSVVLASDFIMGVLCSIYCQPCKSSPRAPTCGYPIASSSHSDQSFLPLQRLMT